MERAAGGGAWVGSGSVGRLSLRPVGSIRWSRWFGAADSLDVWPAGEVRSILFGMTVDEVRERVGPLLSAKGAIRAYVFGSVARGTDDGRSDLDLMVIDDEDLPYLARLDKYHGEIVERVRRPVDLFVYREAELEAMRERPFVRRALAEGAVIHE